ncbi:hypothetical protein SARC_16137 [Sphaeroforma arctica JP610]|uniref:Uncharacterized protein n=1 Tax=Sphaeroforma arctica JP610 TaxID=667725 RepID=A0A0L0F3L7_9EUKA|nr:hypothetical protein SARC_16137 [Sphaeroforma arctica JP610]KNC71325.1 hypothetical protein SARC_16137 [Sphaeroforma arctica JP610]|eukprot:XP_014145227.1 hypothetical protein SARC_16137 [Sphaeroforma arctica JP610]
MIYSVNESWYSITIGAVFCDIEFDDASIDSSSLIAIVIRHRVVVCHLYFAFTFSLTYHTSVLLITTRYSAVAEAEAKAMLEAGRRAKEREQRRKERRERMEAVTSALNAEIDRKRDQRSQISRVDYHKSIPAPTRVPTQISEREVVGDSVKAVEAEGESTCNEESATPATEKHVPETTTSKVESPVQETENGYDVNTAQEEEEEELELTEAEDAGKAEVESEVEAEAEIDAKSNENPFEVSSMAEESNEESGSELSETCADEEADTDIVGEESVEAEQEQVEEKVVQKDEVMTEVKACTEAVEDKEYTLSELQAMVCCHRQL